MQQVKCLRMYAKRAVSFLPKRKCETHEQDFRRSQCWTGPTRVRSLLPDRHVYCVWYAQYLGRLPRYLPRYSVLCAPPGRAPDVLALAWEPQAAIRDLKGPMLDDLGRQFRGADRCMHPRVRQGRTLYCALHREAAQN